METSKKIAIATVALGATARLLPHPWNFTPIMAIGLYTGVQAGKLRTGILATLAALLLSDVAMRPGFYPGMWWVYGASLIPVLIGRAIGRNIGHNPGTRTLAAGALVGSISFFLITNFMVWLTYSLYPHTLAGLGACYAAALPFFQNQLLGDAFYTVALFGGHAIMSRLWLPQPQTA